MSEPVERTFGPITFLPGPNRGKYPFCHSLFIDAGRRVVIDPASDRDRLAALREGPGVDEVWLSHYHEDHLTNLDLFEDLPLCMSAPDGPALASLDAFHDAYGIHEPALREQWSFLLQAMFNFRPREVTRTFADGEVIDLGGVTVEVLLTPGHTAGHCAFLFREVELLFLADYDLTPFGPWYGDDSSDLEATIASVERLRRIPAKVWITGHEHGLFEQEPGALWDAYLAVIDHREQQLVDLLAAPRTMEEIVAARIVYQKPREPKMFFDFAERATMQKHLTRLEAAGAVVRDGERYARV